jgi:hypothetical protein
MTPIVGRIERSATGVQIESNPEASTAASTIDKSRRRNNAGISRQCWQEEQAEVLQAIDCLTG